RFELRQLADTILGKDHRLKPYYDLGLAFGEYMLELFELELPTIEPLGTASQSGSRPFDIKRYFDIDLLPDIRYVVRQASLLPQGVLGQLPLWHSLVRIGQDHAQLGQASILSKFYEVDDWFHFYDLPIDRFNIQNMMLHLECEINYGLERIGNENGFEEPFHDPQKPSW